MSRSFWRLEGGQQDAIEYWLLPSHQQPKASSLLPEALNEAPSLPSEAEIEAIKQAAYQAGFEQGEREGKKMGYEEGHIEGFQQGEILGQQAGLEQQKAALESELAHWQDWIERWQLPLADQEQALVQRLTRLVKDWVETFIGVEMRLQPDLLKLQIEESLRLLPEANAPLMLTLSPLDAQALQQLGVDWPFIEDDSLERGSFIVKRAASAVVWRLSEHLLPYLDELECRFAQPSQL